MLESLSLRHVGPASSLDIDFAPRLNLLTGDNGLGKTFLLDIAWWALTRTWAGLPALPRLVDGDRPAIAYAVRSQRGSARAKAWFKAAEQSWGGPEARKPLDAIVVYGRVDGGFSIWEPTGVPVATSHANGTSAPGRPVVGLSLEQVWDGLALDGQVVCNGLIRDWVTWQLQGSESFRLLEAVLKRLSTDEEPLRPGPPARISVNDAREIPTLELPYGTVPVTHASAGMRRIMALAYVLVWAWQEHHQLAKLRATNPVDSIVLLIDEVEAHLHPRWQRVILPALLEAVSALSASAHVQVLATSHSPLVAASMEPLFDEAQDALVHFALAGTKVRVEAIPWSKQGDVVGWLVSEAFGLRQARSREAERAIEAAEAWMRGAKADLPAGLRTHAAIQAELERVLAGHDPFWPRWVVHVERKAAGRRR